MTRVVPTQLVPVTSTLLVTTKGGTYDMPDRIIIQNNASDMTLYIAFDRAATTSDFPIPFGGSLQYDFSSPTQIYGISAGTGTNAPCSIITRY